MANAEEITKNIYIFSHQRFSNLSTVFTSSEKYETETWESENMFDCDENSLIPPYKEECGIVAYCLAWQRNLWDALDRARQVTVIVNPKENEIDMAITALALTATYAYIAVVPDFPYLLTSFQKAYRGLERINDYYPVKQGTRDDVNKAFNEAFQWKLS